MNAAEYQQIKEYFDEDEVSRGSTVAIWDAEFRLLFSSASADPNSEALGMRPWDFIECEDRTREVKLIWMAVQLDRKKVNYRASFLDLVWDVRVFPTIKGYAGGKYVSISRPIAGLERLSEKERQVVIRMGKGNNAAMIAEQLGIATGTVKAHCQHIRRKLQLRDHTALAAYAGRTASTL